MPATFGYTHPAEAGIDLLTLLKIIWKARLRILVSVCCFAFTGLLVSLLWPQKWTSKSIITPPEPTQWNQLLQMLAPLEALGVNVELSRDDTFNLFLKKFSSQQELGEYISSSSERVAHLSETKNDAMDLNRAVAAMSEQMKAVNNNAGKTNDSLSYNAWTLSFTASNSREAQSTLNGYIAFIASKVVKQSLESVRNALNLEIQTKKDKLELEREKLVNLQKVRIKRLNYSLQVAKAAGIIRPVYSSGQAVRDDPDFSIALGADGIASKLEIEKSMTDMTELNPEFRDSEYQLSLLEKISIKDIIFPVFNYQQPVSLPVKMDSPGTMMFVILFSLLGGLLSCAVALVSEYIFQGASGNTLSEAD